MKKILFLFKLLILISATTLAQNSGGTRPSKSASAPLQRVGGVITFDTGAIYNTIAAPFGGTITIDQTGAVFGVEAFVFYNGGALPSGVTLLGGSAFVAGQLNYLKFVYINSTNIGVSVISLSSIPSTSTSYDATPLVTNNTVTFSDITGLTNIPLAANSKYVITGKLRIGCSTTNGVLFGAVFPTGVNSDALLNLVGNTTTNTFQLKTYTVAAPQQSVNAFATTVVSTTVGGAVIDVYWDFVTTSSGTFGLQFSSKTAGDVSTIYTGFLTVRKKP